MDRTLSRCRHPAVIVTIPSNKISPFQSRGPIIWCLGFWMSVFQECNWAVCGTDYSAGESTTDQLISHITDDKPWQLTNPLSKYVKFSEVCHALFIRKMHFNDQSINFSWHHNFIDLLMMRCIKQGLFVTLQVYGGFFLDIFLPYQKIWSRSHQLTQPVLLIHKLFLFLQYFLVVTYCSIIQWGRKWSRNNRIRNSL